MRYWFIIAARKPTGALIHMGVNAETLLDAVQLGGEEAGPCEIETFAEAVGKVHAPKAAWSAQRAVETGPEPYPTLKRA